MRDDIIVERETEGSVGMPFGQSAGTWNQIQDKKALVWIFSPSIRIWYGHKVRKLCMFYLVCLSPRW